MKDEVIGNIDGFDDQNSQSNNNDEYGDELDQANNNKKLQFDRMLTLKQIHVNILTPQRAHSSTNMNKKISSTSIYNVVKRHSATMRHPFRNDSILSN